MIDPLHPSPDRRQVLRGLGALVALPWLETLDRWNERPPIRLAVLFMPNGVLPETWWPKTTGRDFDLPLALEPLEPIRNDVLVFRGLYNQNSLEGEGHYVKTTALLSGAKVRKTGGRDLSCGVTVDQVLARHHGSSTRLPSLELGTEPLSRHEDMGYSTVYGGTVSWRGPESPCVKEIHPRWVYDRLFRSLSFGRRAHDETVVDLVLEDGQRLRRRLSGRDRERLDEYLEGLHALESRIGRFEKDEALLGREALALGRPKESLPASHEEHAQLMLDLVRMAFATDATRVATFMFGNSVSGRNFAWLDGVSGAHHPLSHHENDAEKKAQYARINRWHVQQFARFVQGLAETKVGERRLLDDCAVLLASGIADGNEHDPHDVPLILAGSAGGAISTGRFVRHVRHTRLCRLYVSILNAAGVGVNAFGDAEGPLPFLTSD